MPTADQIVIGGAYSGHSEIAQAANRVEAAAKQPRGMPRAPLSRA
ncbi:hypothetical protein [Falsiroseomonas sp.]